MNLDQDTEDIINAMVQITGRTKEQAVLVLVEFGMMGMIAAISPAEEKEKYMQRVYDAVNNSQAFQETAAGYKGYWQL